MNKYSARTKADSGFRYSMQQFKIENQPEYSHLF